MPSCRSLAFVARARFNVSNGTLTIVTPNNTIALQRQ